MRHLYAIWGSD